MCCETGGRRGAAGGHPATPPHHHRTVAPSRFFLFRQAPFLHLVHIFLGLVHILLHISLALHPAPLGYPLLCPAPLSSTTTPALYRCLLCPGPLIASALFCSSCHSASSPFHTLPFKQLPSILRRCAPFSQIYIAYGSRQRPHLRPSPPSTDLPATGPHRPSHPPLSICFWRLPGGAAPHTHTHPFRPHHHPPSPYHRPTPPQPTPPRPFLPYSFRRHIHIAAPRARPTTPRLSKRMHASRALYSPSLLPPPPPRERRVCPTSQHLSTRFSFFRRIALS